MRREDAKAISDSNAARRQAEHDADVEKRVNELVRLFDQRIAVAADNGYYEAISKVSIFTLKLRLEVIEKVAEVFEKRGFTVKFGEHKGREFTLLDSPTNMTEFIVVSWE